MTAPTSTESYHLITDDHGRVYRIGESPQQLTGHGRSLMVWLPWIAMMGISVFEYGYGAAADTLQSVHHWSMTEAFWIVTIWAVFQAGIAFPAGRLREKDIVSARTALLLGAVFTAIGFLTISHAENEVLIYLGYSVLGGTGAGLVYATCINMVGKWFPEKKGARTGFVNGGFAYGAVPFIYVFSYWFNAKSFHTILDLIALYMFVILFVCAIFFKDPPKNWWPADVDPREWRNAQTAAKAKSLAKNPPATAQFGPMAAIKTGMLPLLFLGLFVIGSVSLFGSAYQVPFAKSAGFGTLIVAGSAGVLSVVNGVGRAAVGWFSDLVGRKQALIWVMVIEGVSQFGLLWTGKERFEAGFLLCAVLAGVGGGAFFPMYAALTPDYFGENNNATNYGLVYSAKLASAIVGIGIGSSVIDKLGFTNAYLVGGVVSFVGAGIVLLYRQPGPKYHYLIPESERATIRSQAEESGSPVPTSAVEDASPGQGRAQTP
jgi:MFS family permease